jgi:hypothetical protein
MDCNNNSNNSSTLSRLQLRATEKRGSAQTGSLVRCLPDRVRRIYL